MEQGELCDRGLANGLPDSLCSSSCALASGTCGNGRIDPRESCDDGDTEDGDGCSSACVLEATTVPSCGDGIVEIGEQCDPPSSASADFGEAGDGNTDDNDGCSSSCRLEFDILPGCGNKILEPGEECDEGLENGTTSSPCTLFCGLANVCSNGFLDSGEECDDGNTQDRDGCSSSCTIEPESYPTCGNFQIDPGETCDDGNLRSGDGCSADCHLELSMTPFCGDNILEVGEQCDDGPENADTLPDHCRTNCFLPWCGDGILDGGEQCDQGMQNGRPSASCDIYCRSLAAPAAQEPSVITLPFGASLINPSQSSQNVAMSPLITPTAPPQGKTGPATLAVMAAGAAAGWSWVRRKKK